MATLRNDTVIRSADGQGTSAIVTASNIGSYGVATNSTYYVGTTQNIFNRASGAQTLTGVSIDGNAATVTNGLTTGNYNSYALPLAGGTLTGNLTITKASAYLYLNGTNSDSELRFLANSSDRWAMGMNVGDATENLNIYNYTTATTNFTILKASGNVGVGTASPSYKLDVSGAINASTYVYAGVFYDNDNTVYYTNPSGTSNLVGLTVANTITGSVSGSSASCTGNAATATTSALLTSSDVRTISPSSANASRLTYGFTSYSNNNTGSWADYLHLRSYADGTGGNDNLVMFNKNAIGMRIWQQAFGSATAYATYKDVAFTDQGFYIGTTSVAINRASASQTLTGVSIDGNAATATNGLTTSNYVSYSAFTASLTSTVDARAPIFYDSNNTAYYIDGASGSKLKYLQIDGDWASSPFGGGQESFTIRSTYASMCQRQTNGALAYWLHHIPTDGSYMLYGGRGATDGSTWDWALKAYPNQDGNYVEFNTSARAQIFYDRNDTTYYTDPASTSRLNTLNVVGVVSAARGVFSDSSGSGSAIIEAYNTVATNGTTAIFRQTTAGGNGNQDIGLLVDIQGAADTDRIANFRYYNGSTYTSRMAIMRGGNVGIGTTSPSASLHIKPTSLGANGFILERYATTAKLIYAYESAADGYLEVRSGADVIVSKISGYASTATYFQSSVGVGATAPDTNLQVVGHVHVGNQTTFENAGGWNKTIYLDGLIHARMRILGSAYASGKNSVTETYIWVDNSVAPYSGLATNAGSFQISAGFTTLTNSARSPIFYDSDNTAYYIDAASTSVFNTFTGSHSGGSVNVTSVNGAYLGVNNTTSTNGYGISLYNGASAGEATYGLMFQGTATFGTHGSVTGDWATYFTMNNDNTRGWIFRKTGGGGNTASISAGGIITASSDVRAPIFYDSNNTAYYLDPASTSNLNALTVAGGNATIYRDLIVNGGGSGNFGNRIIVQGTATTYTLQDSTLRPTVYLNGEYPVVTLNATATTNGNHGPTLQFAFNGLTTGGATSRQIVIGANGVGSWLDFGFSGGANGDNSSYNPHNGISGYNGVTAMRLFSNGLLVGSTGTYPNHVTSTSFALDVRGTGSSNTDFRAPIFYDSNNTAYYINPAGNSIISSLTFDSNITIYKNNDRNLLIQGGGGTDCGLLGRGSSGQFAFQVYGNGSGSYGFLDGAWAGWDIRKVVDGDLFLNDNATYYLNPASTTNLNNLTVAGDVRSPIFYDSNNTAYYLDPASNSVLNGLYVNAYYNLSNDYKDIYVYGDVNTYYVVLIQGEYIYSFGRYSVTRGYNWAGPDTWNTASHKGGLTLDWEWSGDTAWGGNDKAIRIIEFNESYSTMVAGLGYPVNGGVIIWLRGGGVGGAQYRIRTPIGSNTTVTAYDGVSATNHSSSTTFTAADSTVFSTRANVSNVSAEILARYPVRNAGSLYNDGNLVVDTGSSTQTKSGIFASAASVRAPIFYDTDNTGYYVDPNSTSNLVGLTVANTITGSISGNSGTVGGLSVHSGRNNEANKVVRTDSNGYIQAGWINTTSGNEGTTAIDRVYASYDGYIRYYTPANFRTVLDVPTRGGSGASGSWGISVTGSSASCTGNAATVTTNANLTGHITSVGNATSLGSFTSAQLLAALTDETGTGANVFATSPTLVSPILGTPTSGNLANCTFPTLNQNTTGSSASCTGNSVTATSATFLNASNYIQRIGGSGNYNTDFQNTPAGSVRHQGDDASSTNNPGAAWWFVDNYRHSNSSNYWGTQIAWGWEDNANRLATRNVTGGVFGSWVYYLNSANYSSYAIARGGDTLDGVTLFRSNKGATSTVGANNTYGLQAYSSDAGAAGMSFHRGGHYAINMGLDPDNVFRIGGWSASSNRLQLDTGGNLTVATNMYANGFYDNNNTALYCDPNGTSLFTGLTVTNTITGSISGSSASCTGNSATTTLATKATRANGNFYIDDNYGNTVVGVYSASRYQGVYAMGDSYKLAADGSTTGSLYGIAWSHPNAGGAAGNLSNHGALILLNGGYAAAISSSIRCTVDMRTPIYYDSDNTSYYIDAGSTSYLYVLSVASAATAADYYTAGWFRSSTSGNGMYNQVTGQHFYSDSANYWNVASSASEQGIRLRTGGHAGTVRGYFYADTNNDVGLLNQAGSWRVRVVGGDYVLFDGSSIRAQIFYDSNDTGYYIDAASTSILNVVRANSYVQKSASQSLSGTVGCTIDVAAAGIHVLTLAASTTISSFTYNYRAPNPSVNTIMLVIKYGGTASITWTNVLWANGVTPTITGVSGYADVYMLTSYQGTTGVWIGTVVSQGVVSTSL